MFGDNLGVWVFGFMLFVGIFGMVWSDISVEKGKNSKNNWGIFFISALIALISILFLMCGRS